MLALSACAPLPLGTRLPAAWQSSPNHDARRANFMVLHHTSNPTAEQALATLTNPLREVSAHYLVTRQGEVVQLVDERRRAWHAGASWWGGLTDVNSVSIGIELDNDGVEPYAERQIEALIALMADIGARHRIPGANVLAHGDIAPQRKVDPGANFPWRRLAAAGLGVWCEPPWLPAAEGFDAALGLQAMGYDPRFAEDSARAWKRRFRALETENAEFDADEKAHLACLLGKRRQEPPSVFLDADRSDQH